MSDDNIYIEIRDVIDKFVHLHKTAQEMLCTKTKNCSITPQQFYLLHLVKQNERINQKIIADKMKITPATLSVRIKKLERQGLLVREVDKNDKRNFILKITKQGEDMIVHSHQLMKRNVAMMFDGVTLEEMESLKSCLIKLQHNLDRKKEELDAKD